MVTEIKLAPMIDNKADAGPDYFFCDGCLTYHPPEYRAEYQSNSEYKKFCHFAVSVIRDEEIPVTDTPLTSISHAQDIDVAAVKLSSPIETTCDEVSTPDNFTRKNRSLRKDLPEDEIRASTDTCRALADRYDTSAQTISLIKRGQRILV